TITPDDPGAWKNRGLAAFDAGDYPAAEKAFRHYLDKSGAGPNSGDPVQRWLDESIAAQRKPQ
ncbi:MAG TPA: tetratricopeptide repeat protein, partial [bacterium]|nr:tetratricopeptide repeat protein [bacterium]